MFIIGVGVNCGVVDKWGLILGVRFWGGFFLFSLLYWVFFLWNEFFLLIMFFDVVLNECILCRFVFGFFWEMFLYDMDRRLGEFLGGWDLWSWGLFIWFLYFLIFCFNFLGFLKELFLIILGVGGRSFFEDFRFWVFLCFFILLDLEWDLLLKLVGFKRRGVVCFILEFVLEYEEILVLCGWLCFFVELWIVILLENKKLESIIYFFMFRNYDMLLF